MNAAEQLVSFVLQHGPVENKHFLLQLSRFSEICLFGLLRFLSSTMMPVGGTHCILKPYLVNLVKLYRSMKERVSLLNALVIDWLMWTEIRNCSQFSSLTGVRCGFKYEIIKQVYLLHDDGFFLPSDLSSEHLFILEILLAVEQEGEA